LEQEEVEASEDFIYASEGDVRSLTLAEIFPEDGGVYTCVLSNEAGEARSKCTVTVEGLKFFFACFLQQNFCDELYRSRPEAVLAVKVGNRLWR